jgi:hypothetical protein
MERADALAELLIATIVASNVDVSMGSLNLNFNIPESIFKLEKTNTGPMPNPRVIDFTELADKDTSLNANSETVR